MFTRYPRSVLRHQLGHTTSVATFKAGAALKRGNDAGLGPPGATAHQEVVLPSASGEVLAVARSPSRTPRRKALRCFTARDIKKKLPAAVCAVEKACPTPVGWAHPSRTGSVKVLVGKFHQLGQARLGGRFTGVGRCSLSRS